MVQNELKKLPDLDSLYYVFYKVEAGKKNNVEINDLIKIYRTVMTMDELLDNLKGQNLDGSPIDANVKVIDKNVQVLKRICKMIEENITMEGRDH